MFEELVVNPGFTSTPDCPFTCELKMQYQKFVESFDDTTGAIVFKSNDKFNAGHDFKFKITCRSDTSDSKLKFKGKVSIPALTNGKKKGHDKKKDKGEKSEVRKARCVLNPVEGSKV